MKIYLVGGAVRDQLLGLPIKEQDWVVVGATVQEMLDAGYRQVGKDFPVFLHPKTQDEYALARTERKVGKGYTGFTFDTSSHVTLEEDLRRRDLTINAIAETPEGELIDPYHGKVDLDKKLLRHVSEAFVEDPVRILRVARFAARFADLGFTVAPETNELMKQMVKSGEVDALVAERVWKELERALGEKQPDVFFKVLQDCEAYSVLFPELNLTALKRAADLTEDTQVRFAALLSSLTSVQINELCYRYRVPSDYRELALLVVDYQAPYKFPTQLSSSHLVKFFQQVDAFRRESRFKKFLLSCEAVTQISSSNYLQYCFDQIRKIDVEAFATQLKGKDIAQRLFEERVAIIDLLRSKESPSE